MINEQYYLIIHCEKPHTRFNKRVPFNWYPSGTEIYESIRRLRAFAKREGVTEIVKIKHVMLQKLETIESQCCDLAELNFRTSIENKL